MSAINVIATTVTTQDELNAALNARPTCISIDSSPDHQLDLMAPPEQWVNVRGRSRVRIWGATKVSSFGRSAVEAFGVSFVEATDNSSVLARDRARVIAKACSRVIALDSATVMTALEQSTVELFESSTATVNSGEATVKAYDQSVVKAKNRAVVKAYGSATVHAEDESKVIATSGVAIHCHSERVTVIGGGSILRLASRSIRDAQAWCEHNGVEVVNGRAILYKATNAKLVAGIEYARPTTYAVGTTVTAPDWEPHYDCGQGLHLSPQPWQAESFRDGACRFLRCAVALKDLYPIGNNKAKTRTCFVEAEVDFWGRDIEAGNE